MRGPSLDTHASRIVRHGHLLDPVGSDRRPLEGPVRDGRHPLRRAAPRPPGRPRGAAPNGPVPRGERAPGVHRGRGRTDRRARPPRPGAHRRDNRPCRSGRHPFSGGPPARHPSGAGRDRDIGAVRPDRGRADGSADATARAPQAVRAVLAVDRVDDARPNAQRRRLIEPRAGWRQPVPTPLDLRQRRPARREVGRRGLHDLVQRLIRRSHAVGHLGLAGRRRQRRVEPRAAAVVEHHAWRPEAEDPHHPGRRPRSSSRARPGRTCP